MPDEKKTVIDRCVVFVRNRISEYDSSHDWWHISRVRRLAKYINEKDNIEDPLLVDIAALFHDYADSKFAGKNPDQGLELVTNFLISNGLSRYNDQLLNVIQHISFSSRLKSGGIKDDLLHIVQDADRLDAIGAIGIARAFNYGGYRNNLIYSPAEEENRKSTINHFYEKLLLLSSMMNTETARIMARERHEFLELFLKQFYREWNEGSF
jgi:uncharacterized protein